MNSKPLPKRTANFAGGMAVTLDKSLRGSGRLQRARNVLKRDERIAQLQTEDRWKDGQSPVGLPKVRVIQSGVGKKKKKKAKEEDDKEGTAPAAAPAKPAAGKAAPAKK
jgi:small basic protein (TIGR04137 family)